MTLEIVEETPDALARYASVPSIITVRELLVVHEINDAVSGLSLTRHAVHPPYHKDYDAPPALPPSLWSDRFDLSHWGFLSARLDNVDVGRAAIARYESSIDQLEPRDDVAVLWDIRVDPAVQRQRVGSALFRAVEDWARSHGAHHLKIETQNVNVPACMFYAAQGCVLGAIHRFAYRNLPGEAQLIWYKGLGN